MLLPYYVVAFARSESGTFLLSVVQGLRNHENLYVDSMGRWQVLRLPDRYTMYPFVLREAGERHIVCFDNTSGLYRETPNIAAGEVPFFDATGKPRQEFQKVIERLGLTVAARAQTQQATNAIAALGLLVPLAFRLDSVAAEDRVSGMYRVDEKALAELPASDFETLRQANALPLIYAQLYSMPRIEVLMTLMNKREQEKAAMPQSMKMETIDGLFGTSVGETLNFGGL